MNIDKWYVRKTSTRAKRILAHAVGVMGNGNFVLLCSPQGVRKSNSLERVTSMNGMRKCVNCEKTLGRKIAYIEDQETLSE